MTRDNLFATEVMATPSFCALNPIILKSVINIDPVIMAHKNQGWWMVALFKGNDPFNKEPVIMQVK
jgi:hypothetical protein